MHVLLRSIARQRELNCSNYLGQKGVKLKFQVKIARAYKFDC